MLVCMVLLVGLCTSVTTKLLQDGRVLITGGNKVFGKLGLMAEAELYNPATDVIIPLPA